MLNSYGKVTGEGSGKIGARDLQIPIKKVTGSLIATERTFIVAPSPFDKVTVTVKKTDGKAGADICVCAKWANAKQEQFNKKEKSINKGKDTGGDSVQFVFNDMAEKIITIHLVHKGFPTDKFEYYVSLVGEFDEAEMQNLGVKTGAGAVPYS